MVRISTVICEFNPLHRGHEATLARARAETDGAVVAVMSGNFTQRSECAVFDKYKRAEAAVRSGADLTLELPFPWCSAGGEFFALGGVSIALGIGTDAFVFGSESGSVDVVKRAAALADDTSFREYLDSVTYADSGAAKAYDAAMKSFGISLGSNDKLASEYVRAARRLSGKQEGPSFIPVKRICEEGVYKSASDIREALFSGRGAKKAKEYISLASASAYWPENGCEADVNPRRLEELEYLFFRFFASHKDTAEIFDGGGGVTERLFSAARASEYPNDFYRLAYTKKYTNSRLRRAALFAILGVTEEMIKNPPLFTRVLASNKKGRELLASNRRNSGITLLTKPSATHKLSKQALAQYELACRADELYSLCLRSGTAKGSFLRRVPYSEDV